MIFIHYNIFFFEMHGICTGMPQMMFRPPPMVRPGLQALGMRMPPGKFQSVFAQSYCSTFLETSNHQAKLNHFYFLFSSCSKYDASI